MSIVFLSLSSLFLKKSTRLHMKLVWACPIHSCIMSMFELDNSYTTTDTDYMCVRELRYYIISRNIRHIIRRSTKVKYTKFRRCNNMCLCCRNFVRHKQVTLIIYLSIQRSILNSILQQFHKALDTGLNKGLVL